MKIQMKLILSIVSLIIVLVAGTGAISYYKGQDSLKESIVANMRGEAEAARRALLNLRNGAEIERTYVCTVDFVKDFFRNPPTDKAGKEAIAKHLVDEVSGYVSYDHFYLIDLQGAVVASSDPDGLGANYADKKFFQEAVAGSTSISEPFQRKPKNDGVIGFAAPVKDDSEKVMGVILSTMVIQKKIYENILKPVKIGHTGRIFLINQNGIVVADGDSDLLFNENNPEKDILSGVSANNAKDQTYTGHNGVEMEAYPLHCDELNMAIIATASKEDLYTGLQGIRTASFVVTGIAALAGIIVAILFIRPVTAALRRGVNFAGALAAGDLNGTLPVKGNDELGMLAAALQSIRQSLLKVISEYNILASHVEEGQMRTQGDAGLFSGEFATLISGTNRIMNAFTCVLDDIPTPVLMLNTKGEATFLNKTAMELTTRDCLGKTSAQLFRQEDFGSAACPLRQAMQTGAPVFAETVAHPDGKQNMQIKYACIPIYNAARQIMAVLQVITDLTDIRNAQNLVLQAAGDTSAIAGNLAEASQQISAQTQTVERGTILQQDRLRSTSTAMDHMNDAVREVAKSAAEANVQATEAREKGRAGAQLVNQVVAAITLVNNATSEMQQTMHGLGDQAKAIGNVMEVISDIADQTNLLALNAAIEAARAGEAGRGFAVVADEVRKLAENTTKSTTEVGKNIRSIQEAAAANVQYMEQTAEQAHSATALAQASGAALEEILRIINSTASFVGNIATASGTQSAAAEEISCALEEINRIAGDTAAETSASASAVQRLAEMAERLNELLQRLQQH